MTSWFLRCSQHPTISAPSAIIIMGQIGTTGEGTRHAKWKLSFRNVGWGGDTSWLRQRAHPDEKQLFAADETSQQKVVEDSVGRGLKRDVLPLKPTVVTVKFGMNDHSYQPFREDI